MIPEKNRDADLAQRRHTDIVLEKLPIEVKHWAKACLGTSGAMSCPSATYCAHLLPTRKQNF